jgi:nicotinamidase-related amidase
MAHFVVRPQGLALFLHDVEVSFTTGRFTPKADIRPELANISRLLTSFRGHNLPTVYSKVAFRRDGVDLGLLGEIFGRTAMASLSEDDPGVQIVPELAPRPQDVVIRKACSYSAFFNTALESICRNLKIDTLAIVGGSVNVGVDSLTRDALSRGFKTVVISDASYASELPDLGWGAMDEATVRKVFLANHAYCLGDVMTTDQLLRVVEGAGKR